MKRFWALFLAFVICLTFAGCSSDEYLKDATNKITIPTVETIYRRKKR